MTVLIADGTRNIRLMLGKYLKKKGFQVEEVCNGVEAMVRIFETKPDIILLDSALPGLSALLICEAVKSNERLIKTLILAMSSRAHEEEMEKILAAGADDCFVKPFTPTELLAKIEGHMKNRE